MKKISLLFLTIFILFSCKNEKKTEKTHTEKPTELIVIGTLHKPVPNFNGDTLYQILEKLQPDFILHEIDSAAFTSDFKFKNNYGENEGTASRMYIKKHPETQLRPFEFEGRNEYRREKGMRPTDKYTLRLVDSLNKANLLTEEESEIATTYKNAIEPLKVEAAKSPEHFNNPKTDSLCERRQFYQYQMIPKITNVREEFANRFLTKPNGEKISYRDGYQLWANFWDTRNQTMAKNIMKITEQNKGKKIVVLTGFMHRYYLRKELKKHIQGKDIILKEFYE
ncbi:hypothetical protein [Aureivirga sp. CE67]|uniref:hypothetical protein n=1 Tax=Aureivirga sp. CE67 TaxID=1788983 RepID=UPI0018CA3272|nr:hypothetical protein [Aureivirga sp. CE67]